MIKTECLNTLNNRELLGMMTKVALPIALQSLIGSSLSFIDNLMVGSLGADGIEHATNAVARAEVFTRQHIFAQDHVSFRAHAHIL